MESLVYQYYFLSYEARERRRSERRKSAHSLRISSRTSAEHVRDTQAAHKLGRHVRATDLVLNLSPQKLARAGVPLVEKYYWQKV